MQNYLKVIKAPIITEKSASMADKNTVVFSVDPKANKTQIKQAVEKIFDVKVESVNTVNVKPKKRRVGKYTGKTKTYKKAYVTLVDGQAIEM